MNKNKCK